MSPLRRRSWADAFRSLFLFATEHRIPSYVESNQSYLIAFPILLQFGIDERREDLEYEALVEAPKTASTGNLRPCMISTERQAFYKAIAASTLKRNPVCLWRSGHCIGRQTYSFPATGFWSWNTMTSSLGAEAPRASPLCFVWKTREDAAEDRRQTVRFLAPLQLDHVLGGSWDGAKFVLALITVWLLWTAETHAYNIEVDRHDHQIALVDTGDTVRHQGVLFWPLKAIPGTKSQILPWKPAEIIIRAIVPSDLFSQGFGGGQSGRIGKVWSRTGGGSGSEGQ